MTRDVEITLITPIMETDEYGIPQELQPERRTVLARVDSVSASEIFEAGRNGLRPEYRFSMFLYDYDDQRIIEYNGTTYAVYRKYMGRNDTVELYVTLEGGANNG